MKPTKRTAKVSSYELKQADYERDPNTWSHIFGEFTTIYQLENLDYVILNQETIIGQTLMKVAEGNLLYNIATAQKESSKEQYLQ